MSKIFTLSMAKTQILELDLDKYKAKLDYETVDGWLIKKGDVVYAFRELGFMPGSSGRLWVGFITEETVLFCDNTIFREIFDSGGIC